MSLSLSLRYRLLVILGASLCLLWGIAATWLAHELKSQIDRTLDQRLAASARMVAALVQQLPEESWQSVNGPTLSIPSVEGIACQVSSPRGEIIARTQRQLKLHPGQQPMGFSNQAIDGDSWRVFTHQRAGITITTADRLRERHQLINQTLLVAAFPFLVALFASLALLWWGVGRGLHPLENLRLSLSTRRPDALEPVKTNGLPRELLPLAETLNQLLVRMKMAMEREQRFTSDAAHELRTPLAAIRTHLQIAHRTQGEKSRYALKKAETATQRLTETIRQLLILARLDGGQDSGELTHCNPYRLVANIVNDLPIPDQRRIKIDKHEPVRDLQLPLELISIAIRNLIDNALKHAPGQSPVTISVFHEGATVNFEISDQGPGVEESEIKHLTERFWRRSKAVGSGLGLSIAHAIIERLDGELIFNNQKPNGLLVQIKLPVRP